MWSRWLRKETLLTLVASIGSQSSGNDKSIASGSPHSVRVASDPRAQKRFFQNNKASKLRDISPHPSRLPLTFRPGQVSTLFLSQLIPKSFDLIKRNKVLSILLKSRTPRLPSCVVYRRKRCPLLFFGSLNNNRLRFSPPASRINQLATSPDKACEVDMPKAATFESMPMNTSSKGWPTDNFPVELFTSITNHLSREDIQNMRLVCQHFEKNVSSSLFKVVVVPFRPEIYGLMIGSYQPHRASDSKGKGKMISDRTERSSSELEVAPFGLYSRESKVSDVDHGMRVFKGWGSHIQKFALSFEVDEEILTRPPEKSTHQTHETFWGEFPWPYERYNRFELTEGLENTADKTHCMTAALSHLTNVSELGLSLDSGLGWLAGPDHSDRAQVFKEKSKVFGTRYTVPSTAHFRHLWIWEMITNKDKSVITELLNTYNLDPVSFYMYSEILTKCELLLDGPLRLIADYMHNNPMGYLRSLRSTNLAAYVSEVLVQKGLVYSNNISQTCQKIILILRRARRMANKSLFEDQWRSLGSGPIWRAECERRQMTLINQASPLSDAFISASGSMGYLSLSYAEISRILNDDADFTNILLAATRATADYRQDHISHITFQDTPVDLSLNLDHVFDDTDDLETMSEDVAPPMIFEGAAPIDEGKFYEKKFTSASLLPSNLTTAQKEWLLETEWAQRAFLSSYVLALMDNQATFTHVHTLTIAKMSSRYLTMLDRSDFWESLPTITALTIMVSPDWRDVNKQHEGWVEIYNIQPSLATSQFALLLEKHIALKRSLKTLHLGYVGGGEHATGLFARNQNILPAPIIGDLGKSDILIFPYVKDITFTNCWFAPNVLIAFSSQMMDYRLQKLSLTSVSLVIYGGASSRDSIAPKSGTVRYQGGSFDLPMGIGYGVLPSQPVRYPRQGVAPHNHAIHNNAVLAGMIAANAGVPNPPPVQANPNPRPTVAFSWFNTAPDRYTWAEVIDAITPGATIAQQRFAQGFEDEEPNLPVNSLLHLAFDSCGYVRLPFQDLEPDVLAAPRLNFDFVIRQKCLKRHMMQSNDQFLGCIVPTIEQNDEDILTNAFHMRLGWESDPRRYHSCEDGQPEGGTGRFSGVIESTAKTNEGLSAWDIVEASSY